MNQHKKMTTEALQRRRVAFYHGISRDTLSTAQARAKKIRTDPEPLGNETKTARASGRLPSDE